MKNNIIKTILERELESKEMFYSFVSDLTKREQDILIWRGDDVSLNYIGKELNLTRERVRQIEVKANIKVNRKKEILNYLSEKLGEYLFNEYEVEKAFNKFYKKDKLGVSAIKVMWSDFNKILWRLKKEKD